MYSFKYDQQDATFYNIRYYRLRSTCFGRFLRPSSGAQELYTQHLVCARLCLLLPLAIAASKAWHMPDAVCTVLELLMMGGETARNTYSVDDNNEYYKTLHLVGCT